MLSGGHGGRADIQPDLATLTGTENTLNVVYGERNSREPREAKCSRREWSKLGEQEGTSVGGQGGAEAERGRMSRDSGYVCIDHRTHAMPP